MIRLENFSSGYDGRTLLERVGLEVSAATLVALIGRNGTGKSTLLRAIAGLNHDVEGRILLDGHPLDEMLPGELARTIAFVNTQRTRIPNMRCRDVVGLGRAPYTNWIGRLSAADNSAVDEAIEAVGMSGYADRTLDTMSDGECQRIMIARALAQATPILLLDEPTSFLDMPSRYELCRLLRALAHERGKTVLFSTHELDLALHYSDSVILLHGHSLEHLATADMAHSPFLREIMGNIPLTCGVSKNNM